MTIPSWPGFYTAAQMTFVSLAAELDQLMQLCAVTGCSKSTSLMDSKAHIISHDGRKRGGALRNIRTPVTITGLG